MKLTYIGKGTMRSKGHTFEAGGEYELLKDTAEYFTSTFPSLFIVTEEVKEVIEEPTEVVEEVAESAKSRNRKKAANKDK